MLINLFQGYSIIIVQGTLSFTCITLNHMKKQKEYRNNKIYGVDRMQMLAVNGKQEIYGLRSYSMGMVDTYGIYLSNCSIV